MEQPTRLHGLVFAEETSHWFEVVLRAYNEPHRHYHTLKHIKSMLRNLDNISLTLPLTSQQIEVLQVAIWFHDIVYIVPSEPGRNECTSAIRAREFCLDACAKSGDQIKLVWPLYLGDAYYCLRRIYLLLNI